MRKLCLLILALLSFGAQSADFTLNGPGTTNNPWTPANVLIALNAMQSDAVGFWPASGAGLVAIHNASYNTASITSAVTIAAISGGDDPYVGAVVRTGANSDAMICVHFLLGSSLAIASTVNASNAPTSISSAAALPTTATVGDVFAVNVAISGGTATVTATQNGTPITFDANTTTLFVGEASLAAGFMIVADNVNGTKLSKFEGTGVAGGGGSSGLLRRRRSN
jgi:hypothetical protein